MPLAASIPSEPQAISSTAVGGAAEAALDPDREDRQADRDDEEVADVHIGEGGDEEAPPLAFDRDGEAAERDQRGAARLLDQQQRGGSEDRGQRRVGAVRVPAAPGAQLIAEEPAGGAAPRLRPRAVAAPLQLRRPLAQPRSAVRALGDVGTDLGAAVLADDAELSLAHGQSRITARRNRSTRAAGGILREHPSSRRNRAWS